MAEICLAGAWESAGHTLGYVVSIWKLLFFSSLGVSLTSEEAAEFCDPLSFQFAAQVVPFSSSRLQMLSGDISEECDTQIQVKKNNAFRAQT